MRSDLERSIARDMDMRGIPYTYETTVLSFTETYKPDFTITTPSGIIITEAKGWHKNLDASLLKIKKARDQNLDVDLRFIWDNPMVRVPYYKNKRRMTAAEWSDKNGFKWASKVVPEEWMQ